MLNLTWLKNTDHVSYCKEEDVLPRLSREEILTLGRQPGLKRTTIKLFVPNLMFDQPIEMGENVWLYMGELCPAYCLYTPWEDDEPKK